MKLLTALLLVLSGCTVWEGQMKAAIENCKHHGGVEYILGSVNSDAGSEAVCNDGTRVISVVKK